VEARQDHILIGTQDILEHPEYFHIHGFRLRAFKNRVGHAMEAAVYVGQGINSCSGRRGRSRRVNLGNQAARNKKNCGYNRKMG
jgi:hypothetical protein